MEAFQGRSWSYWVVLGAILWAFIAKNWHGLLKIDLCDTPTKGLVWPSRRARLGKQVTPPSLSFPLSFPLSLSLSLSLSLARARSLSLCFPTAVCPSPTRAITGSMIDPSYSSKLLEAGEVVHCGEGLCAKNDEGLRAA